MTPEQLRAARNWLGWTQQELATHASVGLSTIKDFESGKRSPIANNVTAIRSVLEKAGMAFTDNAISGPIATKSPP